MADPNFSIPGSRWQSDLEKDHDTSIREDLRGNEHFRMSYRLQYGKTAMPPAVCSGFGPAEVKHILDWCNTAVHDQWKDVSKMVREHENEIQDGIEDLPGPNLEIL